MNLRFLGTRGNIEARSRRHRMHSALRIEGRRGWVMVDCGADWLEELDRLEPAAIVVTHAHPDHAGGLRNGAPCPVYATDAAWQAMARYPLRERRTVPQRRPVHITGLTFEAFPVEHSVVAPAVGYRITLGGTRIFYVPDVVSIPERRPALAGVDLYIGDGATLTRPIIRRRGEGRIGHAPIRTQLDWCRAEGVGRAIFTHCGSQIVAREEVEVAEQVRALAAAAGVEARIADDGLELSMP